MNDISGRVGGDKPLFTAPSTAADLKREICESCGLQFGRLEQEDNHINVNEADIPAGTYHFVGGVSNSYQINIDVQLYLSHACHLLNPLRLYDITDVLSNDVTMLSKSRMTLPVSILPR